MEAAHPTEVNPVRFTQLDSLRGVAACTVVLGHFWSGMGTAAYLGIWNSPLRFLVAGHDAVVLFFVLSGFVLLLPYERSRELGYSKFSVKRICRIYLPYLAALALAVVMNSYYHGLVTTSGWINQTWNQKPDGRMIMQHVLFLGDYPWAAFNTAFWSLVYEMRISLIFPFLAVAVIRFGNIWMLGVAVVSSLLSVHYDRASALLHLTPPPPQFADTLHYMSFFILGAMLAKNREFLKTQYNKLPFFALVVLVSVAIVLYYNVLAIPEFANRILPPRKVQEWATASGSLIFILLALYSTPFIKLLNHAAVNYVGRISYSLYLVHATVLFTILYILGGHLTLGFLPIYLVVVFGLAAVFYHLVERPSLVLGQRLGRMLD